MQRFTISLDDALALQFDALIADKGYVNRSEAVRDLLRSQLGQASLGTAAKGKGRSGKLAKWCVANLSYVYDHHEQAVTSRVLDLQHDHHDLVVTSLRTHLDHDHCMETVVLRGPIAAVQGFADALIALRGVRHGHVHLVPLDQGDARHHAHGPHQHGSSPAHTHLKPIN